MCPVPLKCVLLPEEYDQATVTELKDLLLYWRRAVIY
jgi:hypothetical protein